MTNTELLDFRFVNRTEERKKANEYISDNKNFILAVFGKSRAGKNFFIDELEKENPNTHFLFFNFNEVQGKNPLKYIADILYNNNNNKFTQFIKNNYKKILKTTNNIVEQILTINANADIVKLFCCLSDINCQFLDNDNYQDSSVGVISKYLKELFKCEDSIVVFKNLTSCDNYYINYIFQILKTTQSFQNTRVRFIISLDEDIFNVNDKISSQLSKIAYIPIKIKKFEDSKYFLEILSNIFNITDKNFDYLEHLFNICDGYPGQLNKILSSLYNDSYELFESNTSIEFNEEAIETVINSQEKLPKLNEYEIVILTVVLLVEYNFTVEQLIDITDFIYNKMLIFDSKNDITKFLRELMYNKKLIYINTIENIPVIKFNELYDKKYVSKICESNPYFKISSKYIYEYIKNNENIFKIDKNSFYSNISYFSWVSNSPDRVETNFNSGLYFYEINEFSMAENIFLRIYESYNDLTPLQLLKIAICFYEFGNYDCAFKTIKNKKMDSLSNNYEFMITKIRVLNINMEKREAVNQIDFALRNDKFNNHKYELLDMKQRILSNIKEKRNDAKIIFDELYKNFENRKMEYSNFLISSMEYYRGEKVQKSFDILIKQYEDTHNQIMLAETLTNKGFDLFWQGKIDDAEIEFNESIVLLESLRIHEISYTLNNLANCFMMKGDYENAINTLKKALYFNESKYVDITVKNNLMICYAIIDDSLYEKYFFELEKYLEQNKDAELDISILLKVKYSLGFVQDYYSNQNTALNNNGNYTDEAISIANAYEQNTLPYLWFKDWKDEIDEDIERRLVGNYYNDFKNYRFEPWLLTITHD